MSRSAASRRRRRPSSRSCFFDVLHLDGVDLIDRPLVERERRARPGGRRRGGCRGIVTDDAAEAGRLPRRRAGRRPRGRHGQGGRRPPYEAGRRGKAWRKVKPVRTLDLVVLAAEWGHGRRRGWLSNLHLGARDPDGRVRDGRQDVQGPHRRTCSPWQTERLLQLAGREHGTWSRCGPSWSWRWRSTGCRRRRRYPGGVALRFARVRRYRDDKSPAEADTIDTVRSLLT